MHSHVISSKTTLISIIKRSSSHQKIIVYNWTNYQAIRVKSVCVCWRGSINQWTQSNRFYIIDCKSILWKTLLSVWKSYVVTGVWPCRKTYRSIIRSSCKSISARVIPACIVKVNISINTKQSPNINNWSIIGTFCVLAYNWLGSFSNASLILMWKNRFAYNPDMNPNEHWNGKCKSKLIFQHQCLTSLMLEWKWIPTGMMQHLVEIIYGWVEAVTAAKAN